MSRSQAPTEAQRQTAAAMTALSHPRRMMIFELLCAAPDGVSYSGLRELTGFTTPTLDHHLRPMRLAKLVRARRKGAQTIYRLAPEALAPHLFAIEAQANALRRRRRDAKGEEGSSRRAQVSSLTGRGLRPGEENAVAATRRLNAC